MNIGLHSSNGQKDVSKCCSVTAGCVNEQQKIVVVGLRICTTSETFEILKLDFDIMSFLKKKDPHLGKSAGAILKSFSFQFTLIH